MPAFFVISVNNCAFGMNISVVTDVCNVDKEIREIFLELFVDILREIGVDYYEDIDHSDNGTLIDSLRDLGIHTEYFHDVNGYRVFKDDDIILEMVESERKMIFDGQYGFNVELEVFSILEDQIDLGD